MSVVPFIFSECLLLYLVLLPQERRDPALSRADYLERLAKDLKEYYGFLRELVDMFLLVS